MNYIESVGICTAHKRWREKARKEERDTDHFVVGWW